MFEKELMTFWIDKTLRYRLWKCSWLYSDFKEREEGSDKGKEKNKTKASSSRRKGGE